MKSNRRWIAGVLIVGLVVLLGLAQASSADDQVVPFVDGTMWKESAPILKRTYLVGISNLLAAEYLYQKEKGFPSDKKSSIRRVYDSIVRRSRDPALLEFAGGCTRASTT